MEYRAISKMASFEGDLDFLPSSHNLTPQLTCYSTDYFCVRSSINLHSIGVKVCTICTQALF